jgi:hypothetical protein
MATNEYHLISHWRVPGTLEQVYQVLYNATAYPRWWSDAFLEVSPTDAARSVVNAHSQGFLPYTLHFQAQPAESHYPHGFRVRTTGDFEGQGTWSLQKCGDWVAIKFEWQVRLEKPLIRWLSWLLKPLFVANHRWAMRRGEEGLRQELARCAALTPV